MSENQEPPINTKVLAYVIIGLLGLGFLAVLLVAVPWLMHDGDPNWKQALTEDGVILLALVMFVFGFYNNTRMH